MTLTGEITDFEPAHDITVDEVLSSALERQVLPELIDQAAIKIMLTSGKALTLAHGRPVEHGQEVEFKETFYFEDSVIPNIDTQDIAHYYQTKRYITVDEGEVVMKRQPASQGKDGITVLGKTIKAKKGKDKKFKKYSGTEVSPDDENLLIAKVHGHPVVQPQGIKIDETLTLPQASLKSGNINFDGSVVVNGDVMPLVSIAATGDVFIKGTVENATIEAGNNIVIGGGVISESIPGIKKPPKLNTKLKAGGEIHAKFLTQAEAKAAGDVKIQTSIINCRVVAGKGLMLGDRGGKGCLIGGSTTVGESLIANELGSVAYVETKINCGNRQEIREVLSSTSSLLHRRMKERDQLKQILTKIKNEPAPVIGEVAINRRVKIDTAIKNLNKVLRKLKQTHNQLQTKIDSGDNARIEINRSIYPRVAICINGENYSPQQERGKSVITCVAGNLTIT